MRLKIKVLISPDRFQNNPQKLITTNTEIGSSSKISRNIRNLIELISKIVKATQNLASTTVNKPKYVIF